MTTHTHDLNLLANVFGPVKDEADRQLSNIRTWVSHPSHSSKAHIRKALIELDGMWKLAYRITGYPDFDTNDDVYAAYNAIKMLHDIVDNHLNDLQQAKHSNPSLLSSLGI